MALGALNECKSLFARYSKDDDKDDETETKVFFALVTGSILDSARKDLQAIEAYVVRPRSVVVFARMKRGLKKTLLLSGH